MGWPKELNLSPQGDRLAPCGRKVSICKHRADSSNNLIKFVWRYFTVTCFKRPLN